MECTVFFFIFFSSVQLEGRVELNPNRIKGISQ